MNDGLRQLTEEWGPYAAVTLYLDRCQVDTPYDVVASLWRHIEERREHVGKVVDYGAGDGRFALKGAKYDAYLGYEIDLARCEHAKLPPRASLLNRCAFADTIEDADVCIGNPPYVRNQDLPNGWRERVAQVIRDRTTVSISGLANAWQYFAFLALASTKADGLVALLIPFEWVSRPSSRALRNYIKKHRWNVSVYRLRDETFQGVLTTSSITIIDKRRPARKWMYYEETQDGKYRELPSPTGTKRGVLPYATHAAEDGASIFVRRGLSPGTQEALTLTEGERARFGLRIDVDVVPCVTSLRSLDADCLTLTAAVFRDKVRDAGMKCWLIRTDQQPSFRLQAYLDGVPKMKRSTRTCELRAEWWKFAMPGVPELLVASGFRGPRPKAVCNDVRARAVGAVFGVYGLSAGYGRRLAKHFSALNLSGRIVAHSNGLMKLEPRQLHTLITRYISRLRKVSV